MAITTKGERTRRRIVNCAATLLAENGVMALNLADVVAAANVTKGALYFHFASKEELIVGLEAEYDADSRRMLRLIGQDADPLRRLVLLSFALLRRQLRTSLAKAHNKLMLAGLAPHLQSQLPFPAIDWAEACREWFRDADEAGLLTPGFELTAVAETFDDCLIGTVTAHHVERRQTDPMERMAMLWRVLLLPALVRDDAHRTALEQLVDDERRRPTDDDPLGEDQEEPVQVPAGTTGSA